MTHTLPEDLEAYFDTPQVLEKKIEKLYKLISSSKFTVVHTGAGISTAAKIPDFRSKENGVWTLKAQGKSAKSPITMDSALPTLTHQALVGMVRDKIVSHVVSQNIDGLHLLGGLPMDKLSELHGNTYIEQCSKCHYRYVRDFSVSRHRVSHIPSNTPVSILNQIQKDRHATGRFCSKCSGYLRDSIIHFSESLPIDHLKKAEQVSRIADLSITMGTSLMVRPACKLPLYSKKLVIINLQKTPYNRKADLVIHAKIDDVMSVLVKKFNCTIPSIIISKHIQIKHNTENGNLNLQAQGWCPSGDIPVPLVRIQNLTVEFPSHLNFKPLQIPVNKYFTFGFQIPNIKQLSKHETFDIVFTFAMIEYAGAPPIVIKHTIDNSLPKFRKFYPVQLKPQRSWYNLVKTNPQKNVVIGINKLTLSTDSPDVTCFE